MMQCRRIPCPCLFQNRDRLIVTAIDMDGDKGVSGVKISLEQSRILFRHTEADERAKDAAASNTAEQRGQHAARNDDARHG